MTVKAPSPVRVAFGDPPESPAILAESIIKLSAGVAALTRGGLNRKAVIALLHDHTKVSKRTIEQVLDGMESLQRTYCKASKAP
ncbi:MAG: hypothetical protein ACM31O_01445 [Bacteroidota bacterium]